MSHSLKIALLSRWYWEENRRSGKGSSGAVQQLAEAVAAQGHEVVVLSQSPQVTALQKSQIGSLEVWLTPRHQRRGGLTGWRDKWAKLSLRHRKVHSDALDLRDFLHLRGPFDLLWAQCEEPDGLVAAMAQKKGVMLPPTVTQIFALRYDFRKGEPRFRAKKALQYSFKQADLILANSPMVAEDLKHYGNFQGKTKVYPHNLTHAFLEAAAQEKTPPEKTHVLFLGALNEKKGALDFLSAISRLPLEQATYVIIGGFTEKNAVFRRRWEKMLKEVKPMLLAKKSRLEIMGKKTAEEVIQEIRRASVVIAPSLYEEFSRVVVEALVLERPVVTTRTTGASYLVLEHLAGRVVPPGQPQALAEAIQAVLALGAPELENARKASQHLRSAFSPETLAVAWLKMAFSLLEKKKA